MSDDDPIDTTACASCETHIPETIRMRFCDRCGEKCCPDCLSLDELRDQYVCAACREGAALYKDTIGAIDFSRRGNL